MSKIKVLAVTGTRADYGLMRPVYKELDEDNDFELYLIVTGMHFEESFSDSLSEVKRDSYGVTIYVQTGTKSQMPSSMINKFGMWVLDFERIIEDIGPSVALVQGDRGEMLALAMVASHMNVPVVHMSGGDLTGSIDNSIRFAISAFANLHLTTCDSSTSRLRTFLPSKSNIEQVGEPGIDAILQSEIMSFEELKKSVNLSFEEGYILATFHPVTSESNLAKHHASEFFRALSDTGRNVLLTYPNTDTGYEGILESIYEIKNNKAFQVIPSLGSTNFLSALSFSSCLAGNSSAGILEAAVLHKPVVNVGTRQEGRERSSNIIDTGNSYAAIAKGLSKALQDFVFIQQCNETSSPYGDGSAAVKTKIAIKKYMENNS